MADLTILSPAVGQTPTLSTHLTTKAYVDTQCAAALASFVTRTASRTLAPSDVGIEQSYNSTTAGTYTVPTDSTATIPVGARIPLSQVNTGGLSIAAASGVTLQARGGALRLAGQYAQAELLKVAANTWRLYGDVIV